ncbi:MAG: hypothetical protein RLZZ387_1431 [Chloroflexota bacterium]
MDIFDLVRLNLLSPMALAFGLGIMATLVKSDLHFPEGLYSALSIYLLLAIGLKGGAELSTATPGQVVGPALVAIVLGVAIPLWCYAILRMWGKFAVADAAALAAHYGSVSAVTFSASLTFLEAAQIPYEGFMPALVALMEIPGIVVALVIAQARLGRTGSWGAVLHEVFAGRSIVLLFGGLVIGFLAGKPGLEQVSPFFVDPFKGALTLFLLEMGMLAARQFRDLTRVGIFLVGFGVLMPILHGVLGVLLGALVGLSPGGAMVLGTLAASASYIAAPAAVRIALPQANPGYYLTAALVITFPFNLTLGLPLYFAAARLIYGI